jgi:hypothetical protein
MTVTLGSFLLAVALLVVVGLFIIRPLLSPPAEIIDPVTRRDLLEAEKEAILEQIRSLDFDYDTGKLPESEYKEQREALVGQAAAVLQQLDELAPAATPAPALATNGERAASLDDIEAAVAQLRGQTTPPPAVAEPVAAPTPAPEGAGADIEAAVAQARQKARQPAAADASPQPGRFCPQCGEKRDPSDRFCAYCGHAFA